MCARCNIDGPTARVPRLGFWENQKPGAPCTGVLSKCQAMADSRAARKFKVVLLGEGLPRSLALVLYLVLSLTRSLSV